MSSSCQRLGSGGEPPSSTATSRSLLERVQADEAAAWERLVALYAPLVFHWCRRWDLREPDIADILQDVFHAVVAHVADFRKEREGDSFRGWLPGKEFDPQGQALAIWSGPLSRAGRNCYCGCLPFC